MPHDRNGEPLKAGDKVTLECVIKSVCEGEYCTLELTTVEIMPGNGQPSRIGALNAAQVVKSFGDDGGPPVPVGLSFMDAAAYARKAVHFLQVSGDECLDLVDAGFRAYAALSRKNYVEVLAALSDVNRTAQTVIAAFKAEFDL